MHSFSAIAIFCEDIREEVLGTNTIVGVLPDNMRVAALPGSIPKLGLYVRINIDPNSDLEPISVRLVYPNGEEREVIRFTDSLIQRAKSQTLESGGTLAGIISKTVFSDFALREVGRIRALVKVGDREVVAGSLNVKIAEATSPTASEPQPAQFPDAAPEKERAPAHRRP